MKKLILAVDFDDTIVEIEKDYTPKTLISGAKEVINWAHDNGCYIIIWTCRSGKMLDEAKVFLEKNKIMFDRINENCEELDFETSRKIYYDILIDDKCLYKIDWKKFKKLIKDKLEVKIVEEVIENFKLKKR